jgi:trimeric autotransporter adhesin
MSKISLAPDASGSGIFTIASPNSNTNRTLTLPDDTGTLALTSAALTGTTDSGSPFETALGSGAGAANTGANNTFIGFGAGNDNTTGVRNTALGYNALSAVTTANENTAVGFNALAVSTAGDSVAVGSSALQANTTGAENTALGAGALKANTTGASNTAVGRAALNVNTTGANNTAVGYEALDACTTAENNTVVGSLAGTGLTTGSGNVAIGHRALDVATTGGANTAVGADSMGSCTTGQRNTAVGTGALFNLTTGNGNTSISPIDANGSVNPTFNVTTENNRISMGHTGITNAYVQVAWTVTSDARDKTNFAPVPHGLNFVNQLEPVAFQFRVSRDSDEAHGNKRYGFKAQDILALEGDDPVIIDNEVPEKLKYQGEALVPVLVNAIKELSAKCDSLQAEINTLKGQ